MLTLGYWTLTGKKLNCSKNKITEKHYNKVICSWENKNKDSLALKPYPSKIPNPNSDHLNLTMAATCNCDLEYLSEFIDTFDADSGSLMSSWSSDPTWALNRRREILLDLLFQTPLNFDDRHGLNDGDGVSGDDEEEEEEDARYGLNDGTGVVVGEQERTSLGLF